MDSKIQLRQCFHGTNQENADKILKEGFKPKTWFANALQDALAFGGKYVFHVVFEAARVPDNWQWIAEDVIPPDRITKLISYQGQILYEDKILRQKLFESNF